MWGTSHPCHLIRGLMWDGQANGDALRQTQAVLNHSWTQGSENLEGGGGDGLVHRTHL